MELFQGKTIRAFFRDEFYKRNNNDNFSEQNYLSL